MAQIGKSTRISDRAGSNIMKALERAKGSFADIPLGEKKLDPRTEKKRQQQISPQMDSSLSRILYELQQANQQPTDITQPGG